ncbi:MAG: DNA mismatch repair protein MutS [Bacteroidaceae bacterium]|nr:DNA mismatch repair protein MutS [Bacteroidaceae bacterium]
MTFKSALEIDCGLRYMYDSLCIMSSCGRKMLLSSDMMTTKSDIEAYYGRLNDIYKHDCSKIAHKLMYLKDIHNTLSRLSDGSTLDDIELFEVKHLAILSSQIRNMLTEQNIEAITLPQLDKVVEILDPDKLNIPSFYIYDSYNEALREVRKQMKAIQAQGDDIAEDKRQELAMLLQQHADLELQVREQLSQQLLAYVAPLTDTLDNLSCLDILIAKAEQIRQMNLCIPRIEEEKYTLYNNMFHPQVKAHLAEQGKAFMPVDITYEHTPVTIIGANMGGKSVVLKSLALNQLLAQYGFGVAADHCNINPVEEIALCIGDEQSIVKGVSSFAGEILAIDAVIKKIRAGRKLLALIDEPARTTNPVEGTALVEGLLEVIDHCNGAFILTTHYNIENNDVKRYRVKGLNNGQMDYTLEETHCGDVPHEAIAIAESLGIDSQWIEYTKKNLNN